MFWGGRREHSLSLESHGDDHRYIRATTGSPVFSASTFPGEYLLVLCVLRNSSKKRRKKKKPTFMSNINQKAGSDSEPGRLSVLIGRIDAIPSRH